MPILVMALLALIVFGLIGKQLTLSKQLDFLKLPYHRAI